MLRDTFQGTAGGSGTSGSSGSSGSSGTSGIASGKTYYLHEELSDSTGFERLLPFPADDPEKSDCALANSGSGEVLISQYITDVGDPGLGIIPAGLWEFSIWTTVDSAAGDSSVVARVYASDSTGETELFSVSTTTLTTSTPENFEIKVVQPSFTVTPESRIIVRYFAITTSAPARTICVVYEGALHYSYIHTPLPVSSGTSGTSGTSGSSGSSGTSGVIPDIYIDSTSGDVYFTDPTRGKNLGVAIIQSDAGRNNTTVTNQFLRGEGDTPTNQNGFVLPWNATLISMSMSGKLNTQTWSVEVRKNGGGIAQDSLTITNQYSNYSDTNNTDFNAGDRIMIYCSGISVDYPHATLFFRRRF